MFLQSIAHSNREHIQQFQPVEFIPLQKWQLPVVQDVGSKYSMQYTIVTLCPTTMWQCHHMLGLLHRPWLKQELPTTKHQNSLRKWKLLIRCQEDWIAAILPVQTKGLHCCINLSFHKQVCRDMVTCFYIFFAWSRSHTFAECARGRRY